MTTETQAECRFDPTDPVTSEIITGVKRLSGKTSGATEQV